MLNKYTALLFYLEALFNASQNKRFFLFIAQSSQTILAQRTPARYQHATIAGRRPAPRFFFARVPNAQLAICGSHI